MKKKITINESDNDSITVTGAEKNKLKVNEQNGKKVKLSELNLLTPDEKRQLEEQSKKDDDNNTNDGKTGRVDIGKGDRAKADWKRDKLIEYTDIIDFLFKEIIVEGLDWSLNKAVNTVTFGTAWALDTTFKTAGYGKDRLWDAIKELRDKKNKQLDKTQNFSDRVLAMHSQKLPQQDQTALNDDNKKLIEGIAGIIRRGEYHNLNFMSPETQEIIKKTDPEKLNEILAPEKMKNLSAAILYTVDMADMYSTNMATTRMLTAKAKDSNAYDGLDEQKVYDMLKLEARKEFSGLLNNAVANGQDITETAKNYFEMSLKANEHIKEEIQKGNYQEKGKQPSENPHLQKIEKAAEEAKDKPYEVQTGLIETAEEMVSRQENLSAVKDYLEKREAMIDARKAELNKRREQFRQTCANTKNPQLTEKARTGQINAQQVNLDQQAFQQMKNRREQTK